MPSKFYHLYIVQKTNLLDEEELNKKLNLALDWYKYDKSCYVIYSNAGIEKLMSRFKPIAEPEGRLFICEFSIDNRNGYMNQDFWDWIKKPRKLKLKLTKPK